MSFWVRSDPTKPEKGRARISFIGPNGETIVSRQDIEVDLTDQIRIRFWTTMKSVPEKGNGRYNYVVEKEVKARWVKVATIPVDVKIEEEPDGRAPAGVIAKARTKNSKD